MAEEFNNNEAEEKKKQQEREREREEERKRNSSSGSSNDQFMREGGTVMGADYTPKDLSGLEYTDNSGNSVIKTVNNEAKNMGEAGVRMVEAPMNEEENDVKQGEKKLSHVADVLSLAIGNGNDAVINSTYNSIDFNNLSEDEKEYLQNIGCDTDLATEEKLNSDVVHFADGEADFGEGSARVDVKLADGTCATITQAEIDQMLATGGLKEGTFTIEGHKETVVHKEERSFEVITGENNEIKIADTTAYKQGQASYNEVMQNAQTLHFETNRAGQDIAYVTHNGSSVAINKSQIDAAFNAQQQQQVYSGMASEALKAGNLNLAEKYTNASQAWAQKSIVTAQFTSHESVPKQYNLQGATVLDKNGVMTKYTGPDAISSLIGMNYRSASSMVSAGTIAAGSFQAAGRMDARQMANIASGGTVVGNKANALQNMANKGYDYLCRDSNLSGKLTKTGDAAVRLSDVNKARKDLLKELNIAKQAGNSAKVEELKAAIAKIDNYKKFGGKVTDFHTSKGLSASQKRGVQFLVGTTGVLNSDVMTPIMQAKSSINTVKSLVNTAGNAGARIHRRAAARNNARMQKLNKIADNKVTRSLANSAQKKVDRLNYIDRKNMARGRGGEAWKNFKAQERLNRLNGRVAKGDASIELIRRKQDKILDRQKVLNNQLNKTGKVKDKVAINKKKERLESKRRALETKRDKYKLKNQATLDKKAKYESKLAKKNDRRGKLTNKAKTKMRAMLARNKLGRGVLKGGSILSKAGNFLSTKFSAFKAGVGKFFTKLFNLPRMIAGYVVLFIGSLMLITSGVALCAQYVQSFFGWLTTPPKGLGESIKDAVFKELAEADINYNQYIIDKTGFELGNTFVKVAVADAKWHYLLDSLFETAPSGGNGAADGSYAFDMDWYRALDKAEVRNIWMREEADNTTQDLDASGKPTGTLTFAETYVSDPEKRTKLDGVNVNLMPILSMANRRMDNATDYRNFRSVQAYCYYMWVATHDKACYDDRNGDGKVEGEDEDAYELNMDVPFCSVDNLTDKKNVWDPDAREFVKPLAKGIKGGCSNIFYHGYSKDSYGVFGAAKLMAASFVDGLDAFMKGKSLSDYMTPVSTELSCTPGLDVMSGNWKDASETTYSVYHMKEDGTRYATSSAFENDKGEMACLNFTTAQWATDEKAYILGQRNPFEGLSPYLKKTVGEGDASSGYTWGATTCGYDSHDHSAGWVAGVCDTENCPYKNHVHDATCPKDASGYQCDAAKHTHTTACCSLEHEHEPWIDRSNPGCWTTIVICQGHCGGHIEAEMNVVVMNTWESLFKMDNFRMCYFLDESCFQTFAHWDHLIFDLDVWMFVWQYKIHKWFAPLDMGGKSCMTLMYNPNGRMAWNTKPSKSSLNSIGIFGSSEYNENKTKDGEDADLEKDRQDLEKNLDGETTPSSSDPDYENWLASIDLYMFDGWWSDPKTIYKLTPSGEPKPITIPGSYEKALHAMHQLYGDNDNNWNSGRTAWGGGGFKDGNELGRQVGVQFPKGTDAKDPGAFFKYVKKEKKKKEEGK